MKKAICLILTWIWCFPQMLAGAIWKKISNAKKVGDHYVMSNKYGGSVSLGTYVFLCEAHASDRLTLKHEQGHTIQSYILGWLYLIVIGLPSILWASYYVKKMRALGVSYYWFYTESWADKLAGIVRDE